VPVGAISVTPVSSRSAERQSHRRFAGYIWRAHKFAAAPLRTFKRSRDPRFAAKLADIVGLYIDPPDPPRGALPRTRCAMAPISHPNAQYRVS
jgi:hypothetical protein